MSGHSAPGLRRAARQLGFDLDDELLCRVAWSRLAEPGDARIGALIQKVGAGEALRALVERNVDWMDRYRPRLVDLDPDRELRAVDKVGGRVLLPGGDEWPAGVDDLDVPPICLWVRGPARLDRVGARSVAVVGARAATAYGEHVATELAYGLVQRGFTVLSGLAYGIDAAAHRGALAAAPDAPLDSPPGDRPVSPSGPVPGVGPVDGAPPVSGAGPMSGVQPVLDAQSGLGVGAVSGAPSGLGAGSVWGTQPVSVGVVAGGIDRAYPRGNDGLMRSLAARGAVVSEVPPGSNPSKSRFLQRNRLIAAIARGTVVVEAAVRSGSLNTARTAAALGRVVGTVPGPVTSTMSAGCHALVRAGAAVLVTDAGDVADLVGHIGADLDRPAQAPERPLDALDPVALRVHDALPVRTGRPVERLCRTAGLDEPTVQAVLGRLSLLGLAERHGAGWRAVRPGR